MHQIFTECLLQPRHSVGTTWIEIKGTFLAVEFSQCNRDGDMIALHYVVSMDRAKYRGLSCKCLECSPGANLTLITNKSLIDRGWAKAVLLEYESEL